MLKPLAGLRACLLPWPVTACESTTAHDLHCAGCPGAVVDWNPSGVAILCQYRYGSVRTGLESPLYAVPSIHWLAARHNQLHEVPQVCNPETLACILLKAITCQPMKLSLSDELDHHFALAKPRLPERLQTRPTRMDSGPGQLPTLPMDWGQVS